MLLSSCILAWAALYYPRGLGGASQMRAHQSDDWQTLQHHLLMTLWPYKARGYHSQCTQAKSRMHFVHRREDIFAQRCINATYGRIHPQPHHLSDSPTNTSTEVSSIQKWTFSGNIWVGVELEGHVLVTPPDGPRAGLDDWLSVNRSRGS